MPAAEVVSTETVVPTLTFTPIPIETSTATPVPIIPKERFTNRFLEVVLPTQELMEQGWKTGIIRQAIDISKITFEVHDNLNKPGQQSVFGRNPETKEILLATRVNPATGEIVWQVAGLRDLADIVGMTIGTDFYLTNMLDAQFSQIMKRDFNVVVLGGFSWPGFWLGPGQYDFSELDKEVDYAIQNGWRVRASHLVWGETSTLPDWLLKGKFTRGEYIQILEQHVKTMVGRYKGRVQEWSVANEASYRSFYSGGDFWGDKIGSDYVEMSFRWAKETDPNSILIFNESDIESPRDALTRRVITKMYSTVEALKEKGVPIDVVGMQMHLLMTNESLTAPKKEDVIATMQKFAKLGVRLYITEFDVDLTNAPVASTEKWQYEAQLYHDMLQACLESGVCDNFTTWGISDSVSWIKEPNADPLMFDQQFKPKPAYFAVRDVLMNFPNSSSP